MTRRKIPYAGKEAHGMAQPAKAVVRRTRGSRHREPRITISFERPMFNRIAEMAEQRGESFATFVRGIVIRSLSEQPR